MVENVNKDTSAPRVLLSQSLAELVKSVRPQAWRSTPLQTATLDTTVLRAPRLSLENQAAHQDTIVQRDLVNLLHAQQARTQVLPISLWLLSARTAPPAPSATPSLPPACQALVKQDSTAH